jgi:peptide-methionine (R)-S-oxide reductase
MPRKPSDADLRARLTPEQHRVTQEGGTERAFTGELYRNERTGRYPCVACGEKLFASGAKYESGSGWPSFWQPASPTSVADSAALGFKPEPGS